MQRDGIARVGQNRLAGGEGSVTGRAAPMNYRRPGSATLQLMATGLAVGGDVEQALESVGVPSYVLDTTGVVRWINPAAERLLGDIRGRHYTSVVAPEEIRRARESVSRKLLGTASATEATGFLEQYVI